MLAVFVFAFRLCGQFCGDLLLDGIAFVCLVGGADEVDGHRICLDRQGSDALSTWRNQGCSLLKAGRNYIQFGVWRRYLERKPELFSLPLN